MGVTKRKMEGEKKLKKEGMKLWREKNRKRKEKNEKWC
jgi:hypothetical protein